MERELTLPQRLASYTQGAAQLPKRPWFWGWALGAAGVYFTDRILAGHVGIRTDFYTGKPISGGGIFQAGDYVPCIPFHSWVVQLRISPVRKRLVKISTSKDKEDVECRLVLQVQPKVHWADYVYEHLGLDYGRTFVDNDAKDDIDRICERFTRRELLEEMSVDRDKRIQAEAILRLKDAAAFHHLEVSGKECTLTFHDPNEESDPF